MILAGAGTGKTYTIIEKLRYLITNHIYDPEKIVCLTFSNEAVATLRTRILRVVPDTAEPIIRTFHSFCAELLKKYGDTIGLKTDFKILLPDEAKILLHKNLRVHPYLCPRYIEAIGNAKDLGITYESMQAYIEKKKKEHYSDDLQKSVETTQFELNTRHLKRARVTREEKELSRTRLKELTALLKLSKFMSIWKAYERLKEKKGLLDYADLNAKALQVLAKNPEIQKDYAYLIVDEFQDTNKMQFDLMSALAPHGNITVVGDTNQSIYRFRGAYKENITEFKEKCKPEDIHTLDRSYRSPNTVLNIAHKLIAKEKDAFVTKNAHEREGEKVHVYELKNEKEEVRKILELIIEEQKKGRALEQIGVLFRTHQQAQRLKRACEEKDIPYVAVTRNSLLDNAYIKKALNLITIAYAHTTKRRPEDEAWWDVCNVPAISREDLSIIGKELKKEDANEAFKKNWLALELEESTQAYLKLIEKNIELLEKALAEKKGIKELLSLLEPELVQQEQPEVKANYEAFRKWAEEYEKNESSSLEDFLYHIRIMRKLGINVEAPKIEKKGIRIMTHHATKGLEYEIVIISTMARGQFPSERTRAAPLIPAALMPDVALHLQEVPDYAHEQVIEAYEKECLLSEERRLAYVACTRAKEKLVLTYAQTYGSTPGGPSPFLAEMSYTTNPHILFQQDLEEKETEKVPEILTADRIVKNKRKSFSPSALLLFKDCQKKYEYKYLYHMPEKEPVSWEEIKMGSFVHKVIEEGVRGLFRTQEDFFLRARSLYATPEWKDINLEEALSIIKVFYERNKHKYDQRSLIEIKLRAEIEDVVFEGYADRIDVRPEGLEIIDYKTGKTFITAQHRNWQLGIYALAAASLGLGPVKRITLDMLRHEKPFEFELGSDGVARDINASRTSFDLEAIKKELLETARHIQTCYETGFKACDIESNCEFCNEIVWKI